MKPRSELYWDTDTTRLFAPPSDAIEPKDATVLERDAIEPKTLHPLMATLPSAGARSMVAEPLCPKCHQRSEALAVRKKRARWPMN